MDKLYISDIPEEYHYAQVSSDYITLYNKPSAQNETLDYYRIYYNVSPGFYVTGEQSFSNYNRTYFPPYNISAFMLVSELVAISPDLILSIIRIISLIIKALTK